MSDNIKQMIKVMHDKIELLAMIQMSIVEYLTDDDRRMANDPSDLMARLLAGTLSHTKLRNDFTEFLNDLGSDDAKVTAIEMNEMVNEIIQDAKQRISWKEEE